MSPARNLTLDQANARIAEMAAAGLKVYDLRGKSADEQQRLVGELRHDIQDLLVNHGLKEDFPMTLVAGSGKTTDAGVLEESRRMGSALQAVVTGGSQYSVMGAIADGARVKIGITCEAVMPFEMPDARYDIVVITDGKGVGGLNTRLKLARELTQKEFATHGGVGTMEEILGGLKARDQVNLLTPFWSPMIDTFQRMFANGYIDDTLLDKVRPVNAAGTPVDRLSSATERQADAGEFRQQTYRIAQVARRFLQQRGKAQVAVLDGKSQLNGELDSAAAFILPPGNMDAMFHASTLMVAKRLDTKLGSDSPHPGIARKPLIVLNVDGFYDGLMRKLHEMEQGGYLMEPLADLVTEIKMHRHIGADELRSKLGGAVLSMPTPSAADGVIARIGRNDGRSQQARI